MAHPLVILGKALFPGEGIFEVGHGISTRGKPALGVLGMCALHDICCPPEHHSSLKTCY